MVHGRPAYIVAFTPRVKGANPGMVSRIHRMFDAIQPGQVLERFNWTVQPGTARVTPSQAPFKARAAELPEAGALDALWLRVERQTISKLPMRHCQSPVRVKSGCASKPSRSIRRCAAG